MERPFSRQTLGPSASAVCGGSKSLGAARNKGGRRGANGGPCPEFAPECPTAGAGNPRGRATGVSIENSGGRKTGFRVDVRRTIKTGM